MDKKYHISPLYLIDNFNIDLIINFFLIKLSIKNTKGDKYMKKIILTLIVVAVTNLNAVKYIDVPPGTSKEKMEFIEDFFWIRDTIIKNMGMVKLNTGLSEKEILRKLDLAEKRVMNSYN
jgi:hypothetical protein